jgi:NADH-quinone oxidoreductase subunit E
MCSGRVDPEFIFEGFKVGIDGIIVMGCHPGDCHYLEGNYEAEKKFDMTAELLRLIGLEKRVRLEWVSASEGNRFAEVISDFTAKIKALGPSPLARNNPDKELLIKLEALKQAAGNYRLRALVGRQRKITETVNVYGETIPKDKFQSIFIPALRNEYFRHWILLLLGQGAKSVKELAKIVQLDTSEILNHLVVLKGRNQVGYSEIIKNTPYYIKLQEV